MKWSRFNLRMAVFTDILGEPTRTKHRARRFWAKTYGGIMVSAPYDRRGYNGEIHVFHKDYRTGKEVHQYSYKP